MILHCGNPREKMWGVIVRLDQAGVVVRGLDLDSVEDWMRTFFVPMHRVQRIDLDESTTVVASYSDRFEAACGRNAREALLALNGPSA